MAGIVVQGKEAGINENVSIDPGSILNLVSLDWVCKYLPGFSPSVSPFAAITSFNDVEEPVDGRVFFRIEL